MRLVLVEWVDSARSPNWALFENGERPAHVECKSVGWLLHDGADCKVVTPHVGGPAGAEPNQGCGDMTIPTRAIVRMVDLTEQSRPARRRAARGK
jgi:hypothetical protein